MRNEESNVAGDTWLTPDDVALLRTLTQHMSADARRSTARALRDAGTLPDDDGTDERGPSAE